MAVTIGFSEPHVAKYSESGGVVTYSEGMKLARGVELSIEVESADDNNFYCDDIVGESETGVMTSGTATITVDGMEPEAAVFVLGLPEAAQETIDEEQVEVYDYDDRMNPPYIGLGGIRKCMMHGVTYWEPIVLTKTKLNIPGDTMHTQEDSIDWQTQELTAPILRDDTPNRKWKRVFARQTSKEAALNIIKKYLKVTEGE